MKKETLIYIIQAVLLTAGIIFLIMSMVSATENRFLAIGLGCINIGQLINIRRMAKRRNQ